MSAIGNELNLGKQYKIYCTSLSCSELLDMNNLPANAIIISSPINDNGEDKNIPSVLMTDYNSKALPLTYAPDKTFDINKSTNTVSVESIRNKIENVETELASLSLSVQEIKDYLNIS